MSQLLFATTNQQKFAMAAALCKNAGIELEQVVLDIDEIQGEDPDRIVRDKARKAFEAIGKPVVVSDDSWSLTGLNGFPGAYMKSINHWLTSEQILDLMQHVDDRTAILHEFLVYQDEMETVLFQQDIRGTVLKDIRGENGPSFAKVTSMEGDDGLTIAEVFDWGKQADEKRFKDCRSAWHDLIDWYTKAHVA